MSCLSRPFLAPTIAALLLCLAYTPSDAARRAGGSAYDGTWSVAIYPQRGACSPVRVAARIVDSRVYSEEQNYQASGVVSANGAVRVSVAGAGRSASGWGRLSRNSGGGLEVVSGRMFRHLVGRATLRLLVRRHWETVWH
jgi:hypothetical protein